MCSRRDQEEQEVAADQVQGPLPAVPVHPRPQGLRQGREAKAELAPEYDCTQPARDQIRGQFYADKSFPIADLQIKDIPKKNKSNKSSS